MIGYQAGSLSTTGENNVFVGSVSGYTNVDGNANTGVGRGSLYALTGGDTNSACGYDAGSEVTTGANNSFLGYRAGKSNSPSGSVTTGDNNVVLGNDNIQHLYCADTSISSSDSRDKTDVTDFTKGLDWIKALRPVTYKWDKRSWYGTDAEPYGAPDGSKKRTKTHIGFLAQEALEVEKANGYGDSPDNMLICNLTEDGMRYGMKYERLVPVLVNAIKELSARIEELESRQ